MLLFQEGLAGLLDERHFTVSGGTLVQDLGIGFSIPDHLHDFLGLGLGLSSVRGQFAEFFKGFRLVGFVLGIIGPLALFTNIVPIFTVATVCLVDVDTVEFLMHGIEHHTIAEHHIYMGVGCSLFANLVAHTEIAQAGELVQNGPDSLMGKSVVAGIVDGEQILSAAGISRH